VILQQKIYHKETKKMGKTKNKYINKFAPKKTENNHVSSIVDPSMRV
jgi:hypothetical protein